MRLTWGHQDERQHADDVMSARRCNLILIACAIGACCYVALVYLTRPPSCTCVRGGNFDATTYTIPEDCAVHGVLTD